MIINLTPYKAIQLGSFTTDLPESMFEEVVSIYNETLSKNHPVANKQVDWDSVCTRLAEIACHNGLGGDLGDDPHPVEALIIRHPESNTFHILLQGKLAGRGVMQCDIRTGDDFHLPQRTQSSSFNKGVNMTDKPQVVNGGPRIPKERITELMSRVEWVIKPITDGDKTSTFVHGYLDGKFFLASGHSACVSPENYDAEIGTRIATENAKVAVENKLWELEGYVLYQSLKKVSGLLTSVDAQLEVSHRSV